MASSQRYVYLQCIRPTCRFRFPSTMEKGDSLCPKCGGPTQATGHFSCKASSKMNPVFWHIEILLDNLRSALNVGSILRTSDAIGVKHVHLCGITPTPDQHKVAKTALGAERIVNWTQYWNAVELVKTLKEQTFTIISLEALSNAKSLFDLTSLNRSNPILLIVGNEITGVDPEILHESHHVMTLPMYGEKESLNVAVALGIAVYHLAYLLRKPVDLS